MNKVVYFAFAAVRK